MKPHRILSLGRVLLGVTAIVPAMFGQAVVKFNGSSTTHKMVLPHASAIAAAHQAKIEFVPNGTGRGLEDLAAGRANVAMVTGNAEYFAKLLNQKKAGTIDAAGLRTFQLADLPSTAATAIVHPSNGVASLTHEQLRGLFTGKITNWKEVGGPDLPVIPIAPDPLDGVWASFTVTILQEAALAGSSRRVVLATDLPRVVSQLPGAIAFLSVANATGEVKKVAPVPEFIPPNYLVTSGDPAEPIKSIIAELQAKVK